MDALEAFETAAKTVRSVGRAAYFYGVAVRGAWTEPFTTAEAARAEAARKALEDKEAEEEVAEPRPPKLYPWGDSIPWPPEADLDDYDDDPMVSDSIFRSGGQTYQTGPAPRLATTHGGKCRCGHWIHPGNACGCGCTNVRLAPAADAASKSPSSTTISARQPEVDGEGPVGDVPPSPAGLPNIRAGDVPAPSPAGTTNPGEFAAVAVREVLAEPLLGGSLSIEDIDTDCWDGDDWYEWREHVAAQVARRINAAAADERVTDRLRDAGFHAAQMFEQHLKAEK